VKATELTADLAESNGSLLLGLWRDSLHVKCGLTACTPGSAPSPTLGNDYGKTLPLSLLLHMYRGLCISVCLSLLVTTMSLAKTAEPIEVPFGVWTRVGP